MLNIGRPIEGGVPSYLHRSVKRDAYVINDVVAL